MECCAFQMLPIIIGLLWVSRVGKSVSYTVASLVEETTLWLFKLVPVFV